MRHPVVALFLTLALGACSRPAAAPAPAPAPSRPAVPVETTKAEQQPLTRRVTAVGSLQSDENVVISAEMAGRVVEIGFEEGGRVRVGQTLFRLDDALVQAEFSQARAQRDLARRSAERTRELASRRLVPEAEADAAVAHLAVAEATLEVARARLDRTRIIAPFAGVVGLRSVSLGAYVAAGDPLVQLEALDRMKLDFRVPETVLGKVQAGQTLNVELDAFPGERFAARLVTLSPRASESTRSIALRAELPNPDGRLRPGLFARVTLDLDTRENAVLIPEAAVFPRGEQNFVYTIDAQGAAELREVQLGQREPGRVEILSGVSAGEDIIVSGIQRLSPGTLVRAAERG